MRGFPISFFILLISCLFFSCKKKDKLSVSTISLPIHSSIRSIQEIEGQYIITGGDHGSSGFVGILENDLSALQFIKEDFVNPMYEVVKFNGQYIIATDSSQISYSTDLHTYTAHVFIPDHWVQHLYKRPLYKIDVSSNGKLHIAGGGLLTFGVVYTSTDSSAHWRPTQFTNELRTIQSMGDQLWAAGFGILITSTDGGNNWQHIVHDGFYFSDLHFRDEKHGVLSTYDGKVYTTDDGGQSLKKVFGRKSVSGTTGINLLKVSPSGNRMVAAGNPKWIAVSKNTGKDWEQFNIDLGVEIRDILYLSEQQIVLVGDEGFMGKIKLP